MHVLKTIKVGNDKMDLIHYSDEPVTRAVWTLDLDGEYICMNISTPIYWPVVVGQ
jgi:hypothetical protein